MNLALNIAVVLLSLALFWCGSASAFAVPNHARNQRLTTDLPSSHSLWSNGPESTTVDDGMSDELVESSLSRRLWFDRVSRGILTAGIAGVVMSTPESAQASGGATAGRYTYVACANMQIYI
jgi:hypothetical protein